MIKTLKALISIPSYSGHEQEIQKYIKSNLASSEIESFFQDDNLVVHLRGENQTRAFIFNGHVDVVDTGNTARWKHDPLAGEMVNGKIYGRGASDMKSGIATLMKTVKSLASKGKIPTDVWFAFVTNEETNGQGTKQFAEWFKSEGYLDQYKELAAVFAEPTNLDAVKYGHRGSFFIQAEITGISKHSSRPQAIQPHPILEMNGFINELTRQNSIWQEKFSGSEFVPPTITPTSIEAKSESPNKTADHCRTCFDLRTIPGYHQEAFDKIQELAEERKIKLSLLHPPSPIGYTKPDAKIVKVLQKVIPGIKTAVNDASNDLGFFTNIGIDGVIFGPGDMSQAHRTDEYADIDKITAAPAIFETIYFAWAEDKK